MSIVSVDTLDNAGKKYNAIEVTYKNLKFGKVETKKLFDFAAKEVFGVLKDAVKGDVFTIDQEKNDKGYWDWKSINRAGSKPTSSGTGPAASVGSVGNSGNRGGYVDDAKKQVMIIRQSSIASAVNLLKGDPEVGSDQVISVAKRFEAYVLGFDEVAKTEDKVAKSAELPKSFDDLDDEIPF